MVANWEAGWNQGTTIATCPCNLLPPGKLDQDISDLNSNGKVALTAQCSLR